MENKENHDVMTTSTPATPNEHKKITAARQEKAILHEFEAQTKEIRGQLVDQLKNVGDRTDTQVAILSELEDFFRKKGELEAEHAKQLEKLAKSVMQKHKAEKNRREAWSQHTLCTVWQQLIDDTKEEAQHKMLMSDLYQKTITSSINSRSDDLIRISKKCREIGALSHSEVNRVLTELHTAMKTYQLCHTELTGVERKFRTAEDEKKKYEESNSGKSLNTRKYKSLCKHHAKREDKYVAVKLKCTKARNEYLMCVRAANAALHRFFAEDLSYLIDCMDLGMDFWLRSLLEQVIDVRKRCAQREMDSLAELGTKRSSVDSKADKQRYFEANNSIFMLPKQFEFRPQLGDFVCEVSAEKGLALELAQRQRQIEKRLEGLRFESDEVWKSLEACERQLHQLYNEKPEDMHKWRNDVLVTYQYYLKKFEYFLLNGNLIERLEARSKSIGESLAREGGHPRDPAPTVSSEEKSRRKTRRIGTAPANLAPRPKLFGGSLDEYVESSGEPIPLVVLSSIRYLSRFSLRNQGLFRVSGSQSEINRFRDAYEHGEDAFAELSDASESNSVAGVLKLYLRELREPLFPIFLFDQFTDCAKASNSTEFVRKARDLICKLPVSHILLLRFLFGFLSHLCEFADENMMEPHNMAICFGPTLLPIPEGKDQVFFHNFVNELVRNLIVHYNEVFPFDVDGPVYDKYAVGAEPEHLGYMDDGDILSEDEDSSTAPHQAVSPTTTGGDPMLNSTYEMAVEADLPRDVTQSTIQPEPRQGISSQASMSSRSSLRSNMEDYYRRVSDDANISPVLCVDMQSRIASELNAKLASREKEKAVAANSRADRASWDWDRPPSSGTSSLSQASSVQSAPKMPAMTSLRDQLHHFRRELNGRNEDGKVFPLLSDPVTSTKPQRIAPLDNAVLDARGSKSSCASNTEDSRSTLCEYATRLSATSARGAADSKEEMMKQLESQSAILSASEPPDVVASAHQRGRAASDVARTRSPPLDELQAMLTEARLE